MKGLRMTEEQHDAWKARRAKQCADIDQVEREVDALGDRFEAVNRQHAVAPQMTLLELRSMAFVLPMPPSVNALYGTAKNGSKYLLDEQRQFRSQVIGIVRGVMRRAEQREQPLLGRLEMRVTLFYANRRRTDTSNRLKALEDALTHAGAYHDDSQIDRHLVERIIRHGAEECAVLLQEIAA